MAATRHMWLLRTWSVANMIEDLNFLILIQSKLQQPHVASGHCIGQQSSKMS